MKKKLLILSNAILVTAIFNGCGTTIDMTDYPNTIRQPIIIPDVCQNEYNKLTSVPQVAVVSFTNNSSFGKANNITSNRNTTAGIGINENGIGVRVNKYRYKTTRIINPKLDASITSALEAKLAEMGGVNIYSRDDLKKIMKEQKLQQSGLMNEKTIVKVGKLTGVKYIITGSIDSVTQKYVNYSSVTKLLNNNQKQSKEQILFTEALKLGASAASGMKITTRVTFKIIDVETGEIVDSIQEKETKNIGKIPNPTYTQIIGGIKDDIMQAINDAQTKFSNFFTVKGYILQVKTDKDHKDFIAEINLGSNNKINPEQTFKVYNFSELIDPIKHTISCDKTTLNVELTVSKNQIQNHTSWTKADGDDANKLRPGMIIKRDAIKNSIFKF